MHEIFAKIFKRNYIIIRIGQKEINLQLLNILVLLNKIFQKNKKERENIVEIR